MGTYLRGLAERLRAEGFAGRLLTVTSQGGMMDAADMAAAPIHAINSGPSMAPVAGRHLARSEAQAEMAIVADTGGTSFDVSLVRRDRIPWTRETWLGPRFRGHMTGFPSVDVKSIGAGGGSIACVDDGGLLQVGPESAGADPGPVCYGRGGQAPTVTDCALVLGYLDPAFFLGGAIRLDAAAARAAVERAVARPLGMSADEAALPPSWRSRPRTWCRPSRRSRSTRASIRAAPSWSAAAAPPASTPSPSPAGSAARSCWCRRSAPP